jgi:hypothetical protein
MAQVFMEVQGPIACSVWGETAGTGIWGGLVKIGLAAGDRGMREPRNLGGRIPPSTYFIEEPVAVSIIWADAVADCHINWSRNAQTLSTEGKYGWFISCLRGMTRPLHYL